LGSNAVLAELADIVGRRWQCTTGWWPPAACGSTGHGRHEVIAAIEAGEPGLLAADGPGPARGTPN